jgi:hypothetical protein
MSHFSETLAECMERHLPPLTNVSLAKLSGVDATLISRYVNDRMAPTPERVAQLCVAISNDPEVRSRLLIAYLRDVAAPAFAEAGLERHVQIRLAAEPVAPGESNWFDTAPVSMQCMLEAVGREALTNPKVAELLESVVNIAVPLWKEPPGD